MAKLGYEITEFGFKHRDALVEIYQPTEANSWYWTVGDILITDYTYDADTAFLTLSKCLESKKGVEIENRKYIINRFHTYPQGGQPRKVYSDDPCWDDKNGQTFEGWCKAL